MNNRSIFLILFVLLSAHSFSQTYIDLKTYDIDSLLLVLPDQLDEERVNTLNKVAISLCYEKFSLAEQYAEEAMSLAKELNYQQGIAIAYWNFGKICYYQDNYPGALKNFFEALSMYEKLNDKYNIAVLYYEIAAIHFYARNFEKVFEYGNIALNKFRERTKGMATVGGVRDTLRIIIGFGETYDHLGMYNKSFEISQICLKTGKENNFGITEMLLHTWLAGTRISDLGKSDSAKVYYQKVLSYPDLNPDVEALKYRAVSWLGYLYYSEGEIDSAIFYAQKSLNFYQEKGFLYFAMAASKNLGFYYFKKKELNVSEKYYQQAESLFNEMLQKDSWFRYDSLKYVVIYGYELFSPIVPSHKRKMIWDLGSEMYYELYKINEIKNRSKTALAYHLAYSDAKDTLNKITQNRETMELQTKFETERKEGQIESLSQKNAVQNMKLRQSRYFTFGLSGLVLLVMALAIILIRQNKLRNQQQNLLLKQKLFRLQMNPHFLFNSLSSIHNLIIHEEAAKVGQYLSKFSKLVRNILDCSDKEYISLDEEITTIENYLELQKIRFPDKFVFFIEIDENIDPENVSIPPMMLQPFIENSIEHGFKQKEGMGSINISFSLKKSIMIVELMDDGIGRQKAQEILFKQDREHKSLATAITHERIHLLNKRLKKKIVLNILDLKDDNGMPAGTKVTFQIPIVSS